MEPLLEYVIENNNLMPQWRDCTGTDNFVKDGIIDIVTWFQLPKSKERILFLLKEAYIKNGKSYSWDLGRWIVRDPEKPCCDKKFCKLNCDCSACKISGKTYNHVAEYAYAVEQLKNGSYTFDSWLGTGSKNMADYCKKRDSILRQVAVVNIKKSGGNPDSKSSELLNKTLDSKKLLRKQIEIIKPTLIICGGTYGFLQELYPELKSQSTDEYAMLGNIKVIAAKHPNARISSKDKSDTVAESYKKAIGVKKMPSKTEFEDLKLLGFETVCVSKDDICLPYNIWLNSKQLYEKENAAVPYLQVETLKGQSTVSICDAPQLLDGKEFAEMDLVFSWISRHSAELVQHWTGEISDREALIQLSQEEMMKCRL